jgi:hypothetical protein
LKKEKTQEVLFHKMHMLKMIEFRRQYHAAEIFHLPAKAKNFDRNDEILAVRTADVRVRNWLLGIMGQ